MTPSNQLKIVTIDSPAAPILYKKTEDFKENEMVGAKEIADKLIVSLKPYMPAAGLAAPQIGIGRSIFIYSRDRLPEHIEVVINPSFKPIGEETTAGWEGCFSIILGSMKKLAKVSRYNKIQAIYLNVQGEKIEKTLEGFAAKVFQHEYDHLQGIVNINRPEAIVKSFNNDEELKNFMTEVKKEDSKHY